jgi:hydroxymethylpyrimidine/phosphomethylpyrimidine kinase
MKKRTQPILTITGSDPTSGSGIQADIKTMTALGGYAMTVITSITAQTTYGIQQFHDIPASVVKEQIEAVMNDFQPRIVKIGLVRTIETLEVIVSALRKYRPEHVIYDAVPVSSQGEQMMSESIVEAIRRELLPLCTLVLRLDDRDMHGMANRYASAVAVYLSEGMTVEQAQQRARKYISTQIVRTSNLEGRGAELYNSFLDHLSEHYTQNRDVHFYADLLNVSSRYLAQVTRRIGGKAPKAIIDEYLVEQAERQLLCTDKTVQQTAYELGFSSQAHFTKFFKKMKGESPKEFRKG